MRNTRTFILQLAAAALILGCSIASAPAVSPGAGGLATAAATLQTANAGAPGLAVAYSNVHFVIPPGLAAGTTNASTTDVELPYINPSAGAMPQHTKIVLDGYAVQDTSLTPEVIVFRAVDYAGYTDLTRQMITALQNVQAAAGGGLPSGLPAGQFNAQVQQVKNANGHGLRYLTQFDESPLPVNNRELVYEFEGLSDSGQYYVQAILPLQAPFLARDSNPASALPANAIPFSSDQPASYFAAVTRQLNAAPSDDFTPSLADLDALVESIAINP